MCLYYFSYHISIAELIEALQSSQILHKPLKLHQKHKQEAEHLSSQNQDQSSLK